MIVMRANSLAGTFVALKTMGTMLLSAAPETELASTRVQVAVKHDVTRATHLPRHFGGSPLRCSMGRAQD